MPRIKRGGNRKPWQTERKPFKRKKVDNYAFYNSTAWRTLSKKFKMLNPICIECEKRGDVTPVDVTDHIITIRERWDLRFSWENLQSLCHTCHNSKSGREAHKKQADDII